MSGLVGVSWESILVALMSTIGVIYGVRQSRKAAAAATALEQEKVDRSAYTVAQQITKESFARLEADLDRVERALVRTRAELDRTIAERDREQELNQSYRARVRRLEAALRDSGLPIPMGEDGS